MSYIKLLKTLPDNRTVEYHQIQDVVFGEPKNMVVKIGSFTNETDVNTQASGDAVISIPMTYTGTYEDALTDLLNKILLLPEWSGGVLVDNSIPIIPTTIQDITPPEG